MRYETEGVSNYAFHKGSLNRREFIEKLREFAKRRKNSFLGQMFEHYADHIEEAATKFPDGMHSLDAPVNFEHIMNAYYGEGSCSNCSVAHPGGSCCTCIIGDVAHCEPCG